MIVIITWSSKGCPLLETRIVFPATFEPIGWKIIFWPFIKSWTRLFRVSRFRIVGLSIEFIIVVTGCCMCCCCCCCWCCCGKFDVVTIGVTIRLGWGIVTGCGGMGSSLTSVTLGWSVACHGWACSRLVTASGGACKFSISQRSKSSSLSSRTSLINPSLVSKSEIEMVNSI